MKLYTLGYEGMYLSVFLVTLQQNDIDLVVDVRLNPISRKRGFSKRSLSEYLESSGVEYYHLPELGDPKSIRDAFLKNSDTNFLQEHFTNYLDAHKDAIENLYDLIRGRNACLMCFEHLPKKCHRKVIADYLINHKKKYPDIEVRHL